MRTRMRFKLIFCLAVFAVQGVFAQEGEVPEAVIETEAKAVVEDSVTVVEAVPVAETAPVPIIPTSVPVAAESSSGDGLLKSAISVGIAAVGLGTIIYGIVQNSNVAHYVKKRNGKAAVDAESSRNIGYGIGAALLAGGVVVYLVF